MAYVYRDGKSIWMGWKDALGRPQRERYTEQPQTLTAARESARERESKASRVRAGLEAPPPPPTTFAALADRYLAEVASQKRGFASIESRVRLHIRPELGERLLTGITAGDLEGLLARKAWHAERRPDGLKPKSLDHIRQTIHAMFAFALRAGLLRGENPAGKVPRVKVPERAIQFLDPAIVARVVAAVPDRWRNLFATAVLTGARKGELIGLRVTDVDLPRRVLTFARSYTGTTKTSKLRLVPINDELVPFLEAALRGAKGGLVFPGRGGAMLSRHVDFPDILRRALVVAGVVERWELVCRRSSCRHVEPAEAKTSRPCPKCGFALWPVAIPPQYQFKDLRSTWGTFAAEATGDLRFVQTGLGHSDPKVTEKHYAAVRARHSLSLANKVRFGFAGPAAGEGDSASTQPALSREEGGGTEVPPSVAENASDSGTLAQARPPRIERGAFGFEAAGSVLHVLPKCESASEGTPVGAIAVGDICRISPVPTQPALSQEPLLTVRQVAERLGVCRDTVRDLCARGELTHLRILDNAIRIRPADLAQYLAKRHRA